jgi:hypothetical protein
MSHQSFVQQPQQFNYPSQSPTNQLIPYDQSQQSTETQLVPIGNTDTMYYAQSNDEEEDAFNSLNQGFALIAQAFRQFSDKLNNRLRNSSNPRTQAVVQGG